MSATACRPGPPVGTRRDHSWALDSRVGMRHVWIRPPTSTPAVGCGSDYVLLGVYYL